MADLGARGPARTPLSTLKARGSWLAKTRDDAPTVEGAPEPPPWMQQDAMPQWEYVLSLIHPSVLTKQDGPHIAELAMDLKQRDDLKAQIAKLGGEAVCIEMPGAWRMVTLVRDISTRIDRLLGKLGMTPADRSHVAAAPTADKGKVGRFVGVA